MKILSLMCSFAVFFLGFNLVFPTTGLAVQISSEVFGSSVPLTTTDQNVTILNGDFRIFRSSKRVDGSRGYEIGDGLNEFTKWNFDFSNDPNFSGFETSIPLTTADLLINLIPKGEDFSSDFVRIDSLPNFYIASLVPVFTINNQIELRINLLEFYSSSLILELFQSGLGVLGMRYEDDAILVRSSLVLANNVPEPTTLLLTISSVGFYFSRKRKASNKCF